MRAIVVGLLLSGAAAASPPPSPSPPAGGPREAAVSAVPPAQAAAPAPTAAESELAIEAERSATASREQASLREAMVSLPLAAALAGLLAFRPRRRHAPPRNPEVVQTQIMLALIGALVMLVVGASLARAFGIAGAASLVRYRAKVSDPKDASVMLGALGIGLASGVGLFWLATVATLFLAAVLWLLEHLEPRRTAPFELTVKADEAAALRPRVEALLRRHRLKHQLHGSAADELAYLVEVPLGRPLQPLTEGIMALDDKKPPAIEWQEKKK